MTLGIGHGIDLKNGVEDWAGIWRWEADEILYVYEQDGCKCAL
jgi:hypothetical protein